MRLLPRRLALTAGAVALAAAALAPATIAADQLDIGFIDQAALTTVPSFVNANRQLVGFQAGLDREFQQRTRGGRDQAAAAKIAPEFKAKLDAKQRELLGPLFTRAQIAIASVASSKNLSVVVDKRIVVFGGQDVTGAVESLLTGPGDPIPPVSSPPPSEVGYVDQSAVDGIASLKTANADFQKYQASQLQAAQAKMRGAKTDAERQTILKDYQNSLADRQKQSIQPLVDKTRDAIASIAKKKNLLLVIDRSNLLYGGQDITGDVTSALK